MINRVRVSLLGLVVATAAMLSACGGGPAPGSIQVRWTLGFGVPCNDSRAGVDTIRVRVVEANSAKEVALQEFSCAASVGLVTNVPVGTYNLSLEGGLGGNFTDNVFTGTLGGVTVKSSTPIDVGAVVLEKVPPTVNPGTLQITWGFASGLCGANNTDQVRLLVWRDLVYKQHDKTYPCDIPAPGHVELQLPPAEYGIIAEGISADGAVVRRGTNGSVKVPDETSVSLTLQPL